METNKKEFYHLFNDDKIHEFTLTVKKNKKGNKIYKLITSDNELWANHFKGIELVKMVDNGNGIKIKCDFDLDNENINYADINYVYIVLKSIHEIDSESSSNYKLVKQ